MSEEEILLVMTIVKLITGTTPSAKAVDSAYDSAVKSLGRTGQPPKEAILSHAHRRD